MQAAMIQTAETVAGTGIAHALTWTLVQSTWVGASAALCLFAFLRICGLGRARLRYGASLAAFFSVPAVAAWILWREVWGEDRPWAAFEAAATAASAGTAPLWNSFQLLSSWADGTRALLSLKLEPAENLLALTWAALAGLALARLAGGFALLRFHRTRELHRASAGLQARAARLARSVGLERRVPLYWCERADVPMVVGALDEKIVLPARLRAVVERGDLDLVLLHELAHVRRRDGLVRALELCCRAAFALNPFLHWMAARVAREREHCCDDIAIHAGRDRLGFVRSLAALESDRLADECRRQSWRKWALVSVPALRATDGVLLERVRRLTFAVPKAPRVALSACAALFLGAIGLALGTLPTREVRAGSPLELMVRTSLDLDFAWTGDELQRFSGQRIEAEGQLFVFADDPSDGAWRLAIGEELEFPGDFPGDFIGESRTALPTTVSVSAINVSADAPAHKMRIIAIKSVR